MHSLRTDGASGFTVDKLKVYDPSDPHSELSTEEEGHGSNEGASKHPDQRRLEFHRSRGVNSRLDGYVIISFMSFDNTELGCVPITHGVITEASRQPTNIVVAVPEPTPLCVERSIRSGVGHWQLHSVGNVTSFIRGMKAISSLSKNGSTSTSLASIVVHPTGTIYGDNSMSTVESSHNVHDQSPTLTSCEHTNSESISPNPLCNNREVLKLNHKQTEAVISSLNHSLTLIHGPPGTGKTRVACEIVCRYLAQKSAGDMRAKVLVAAETNMAVDNLARQLMHQQVHVIRIGNREQTSDDVYSRISLESLVSRISESKGRSFIDRKIAKEILSEAEVVATTCAGAGDSILKSFKFPFIIIDEATQVFLWLLSPRIVDS